MWAIEPLMGLVVEVVGADDQRHVVADVGQQQHAAQHPALGFQAARRLPVEDFRRDSGRRLADPSKRWTVAMSGLLFWLGGYFVGDRRHDPDLEFAFDLLAQVDQHGVQAQFLERTLEPDLVGGDGDLVALQGGDDFRLRRPSRRDVLRRWRWPRS